MKKRVLSLLLMLAMVLTALPVVALPVFAAEPEEEEEVVEFNYDKLYYTKGLVFAIDFFKSNEFWDPEGDDFVQPVNPVENSAYLHTDGVTYDFTVPENRLTADGTALHPAYTAAINAWAKSATGTDRDFLRLFTTKAANSAFAFSYVASLKPEFAKYFLSAYQLERGYVLLREESHSSGGLQISGLGSAANFSDNTAMHIIYDASESGRSNPHILWHNLRPSFDKDGKLTGFADGADTFTVKADGITSASTDFSVLRNEVYQLTGAETKGGTEDVFTIWDKSGVLASAQGTYDPKPHPTTGADRYANFINTVYLNWSDHMNNGKVYAIRQYNDGFASENYAQNNFADLCKWYKLDMGLYDTLNPAQVATLQAEILAFADAEGIAVGGDAAARDTLQEKFTDSVLDIAYSELTEADSSAAALAFSEVAKSVMADITGVLALPAQYRGIVYKAVNDLTSSQKENLKVVQKTIDEVIDEVLETNYGEYIVKTDLTYKDLYVKQDNIVLWMDFFAARETDGKLYMDHYHDPNDPNYQKVEDGTDSGRKIIACPELDGEKAAREKYIYRGDKFFTFADIKDAYWGHTNIRTWGNGKLICGLNNSFNVKSPGVDVPQLSYQFVCGWENNNTSARETMNVQLDGYRMYFDMDAGNTEGYFNVNQYERYGYGVATDTITLSNNALIKEVPGKDAIHVGDMLDITITMDKFIGEDNGHYFLRNYDTNADGARIFYESDVTPTANNKGTLPKLYRYKIDGAWYYLSITEDKDAGVTTYAARYAETMAEKPKALADAEGNVVESVPVIREGDTMRFDWDNAVYKMNGEEKVLDNGTIASNVYGPLYKNSFEEVPFGTPGADGPITYFGVYDLGVYANGTQFFYSTGNSYQRSDIGWVGNSGNMTFYAVRTYNIILTEDEIRQNHFADLAGYYGLDLSTYSILSEAERRALHNDLKDLELGLDYAEGAAEYAKALDKYLYAFDLTSFDTEQMTLADNFLALCQNYALDTRDLKELSPESLLRIFTLFKDVDPTSRNHAPVMQKQIADAVEVEKTERYASAYGHKSINFEGWQVRVNGDFGLRALYSTDTSLIPSLELAGATVMTGVLVAKHGADGVTSLDQLTVSVDANGEVVIPEKAQLIKGYWAGELGETATKDGNTIYFTHDTIIEVEDPEDDAMVAEALESEKYFYAGFTVLVVGEGDDRTVSIFYDDAVTDGGKNGPQSVYSLSRVAQKYKMSGANIQKTMNLIEETAFIEVTVGNRSISEYVAVISSSREGLAAVQNSLETAVGFTLNEIRSADSANYEHLLYVGSYDNVYDSKCYGVSVYGGNIYIWANADADVVDACAIFAEYVLTMCEAGENIYILDNYEVVRRVAD